MTHDTDHTPLLDDPVELDRFLHPYRPSGMPEADWLAMAPEAIAVVKNAGALTRLRVERDIKAVGAVAKHLRSRGRSVTLAEVLTDATLLDFDLLLQRLGRSNGTRENQRGILRRLQAVHRGLPWRRDRRADGERAASLPGPEAADRILRLERRAQDDADRLSDSEAPAFVAAVAALRHARRNPRVSLELDDQTWRSARAFAARHDVKLTRNMISTALTHEVLREARPLAELIVTAGLTRRDLDLGLTHATTSADVLTEDERSRIRGQ